MSMEMILLDKSEVTYDPFDDEKCEIIRYRGNYPLYECMCKRGAETKDDFLVFTKTQFSELIQDVKELCAAATRDQEEWKRIYHTLQQVQERFSWDNRDLIVYLSC